MDLCHVRCACMAGPKSVNKIIIVFCLGERRFRGLFFVFCPDSLLSPSGVVFSPFPFSLLCPLSFSIL
ncbi:hypothetical protein JHK85_049315 [Glycine max]|nr:hypothetical protein JHK87_048458 [Glycine soja]KAG4944669.1 hypothetical protein JHK85_049315 [Glycine max]KHN12716.1 hypothetical protein glysoja_008679 [Glycine soja]